MLVYFLRHASAGQRKNNPQKDEKRPLDEDGIAQCGFVGRALAALETPVDAILSSPLKRAAQTASLVANELGYEGTIAMVAGAGWGTGTASGDTRWWAGCEDHSADLPRVGPRRSSAR